MDYKNRERQMTAVQLLTFFTTVAKKTEMAAVWVLAVFMCYQTYQLQQLTSYVGEGVHKAGTDYAFNVIEYGLKDLSTQDAIIAQVEQWHADKWGAQIGAIETICSYNPNRLTELVDKDTSLTLCRIVR